MKVDAVFEGGGVKGIGLVGGVCYLEEQGYKIQRFAGTSAGAMVAALLAVGYTGKELKDILLSCNFKNFLDTNVIKEKSALIKSGLLVKNKGIYSGESVERFIEKLLYRKGKTKFKDVSVNGKSKLKIIASDITRKTMIILPDDIKKYDIDPMEFEIAKAVRMSISIPCYFRPVKMCCNNKCSFIVDGGILSNFPIWIFDGEGIPKWPTFGFKFKDDRNYQKVLGKNNFVSFLLDILTTIIDKNEEVYIKDKDKIRTVVIPTLGIRSIDFDITDSMKLKLFNAGYESCKTFLKDWNFRDYLKRYRMNNIRVVK